MNVNKVYSDVANLKIYNKPIKFMYTNTEHLSHKGLNNRVENAPNRRAEKRKALLSLNLQKAFRYYFSHGKVRNIFAIGVNRYKQVAQVIRQSFKKAKEIWFDEMSRLLCI